jgi:hypothetical protein
LFLFIMMLSPRLGIILLWIFTNRLDSESEIASILKARHAISVPERTIREQLHRRALCR